MSMNCEKLSVIEEGFLSVFALENSFKVVKAVLKVTIILDDFSRNAVESDLNSAWFVLKSASFAVSSLNFFEYFSLNDLR
jgi:hypothetical protein